MFNANILVWRQQTDQTSRDQWEKEGKGDIFRVKKEAFINLFPPTTALSLEEPSSCSTNTNRNALHTHTSTYMPIHKHVYILFNNDWGNLGTLKSSFLTCLHVLEPHTAALHSMTSLDTLMLRCCMTGRVLSLCGPHTAEQTPACFNSVSALTDTFHTVRNSMFSPIGLLWRKSQEAGHSQKNKQANSDHFTPS